jgi:hypothetical protein
MDFCEDSATVLKMIYELLKLEEGLTEWEINFLDSLLDWEGNFTIKQADRVESIYKRVM